MRLCGTVGPRSWDASRSTDSGRNFPHGSRSLPPVGTPHRGGSADGATWPSKSTKSWPAAAGLSRCGAVRNAASLRTLFSGAPFSDNACRKRKKPGLERPGFFVGMLRIKPCRPNPARSRTCACRVSSARRGPDPDICGGRTRRAGLRRSCGWLRSSPDGRPSRC